jgi:hypothetical protein
MDAQLGLVKLFYEVAFLDSRRQAGLGLSQADEDKLMVFIAALGGDPGWSRRRFRRKATMLAAVVKTSSRLARGTVLNMSPGGMLLTSSIRARVGESILVKIGRAGGVQHSFPCQVVRVEEQGGAWQVGVRLAGIPLQVCYGSSPDSGSRPADNTVRLVRRTG